MDAAPVLAPKQPTFVCVLTLLVNAAAGCEMVTFRVVEHPFASVTVHVHVPATKLFAIAVFCTGVVFQLKEYGAVPPIPATVALPVAMPKQPTLVCAETLLANVALGCVIVTVRFVVQPLASDTVQIHVPAVKLFAVAVFCTGVVFQLWTYGVVPPVTATVALPVLPPKQPTLVCALKLVASAAAGCRMVTLLAVEHPFASDTVQVQVPAIRLVAVALVCTGVVFHE